MAIDTAGAVPLDAPLPQPRRFTLLDTAGLVTGTDERWLAGGALQGYPPGPAYTHDPCGEGTYRVKATGGEMAAPRLGTFTVYVPGVCTAKSIGSDPSWYKNRLGLAFQAVESTAVERFLATGDGHALLGPYITDGNLDILNSGAATNYLEGLALLEDAIATVGSGMIHVTPALAVYLASMFLIAPVRGMMQTTLGTPVAVGAGYVAAYPDNAPGTPPDGQEWAYATAAVQYRRDADVTIMPGNYAQAIDRSQNEVVFIAERSYLLSWVGRIDSNDETNIQAGVLIDRTDCTCA